MVNVETAGSGEFRAAKGKVEKTKSYEAGAQSFGQQCPPELIENIGGYAAPPTPRRRPVHALKSVMKLIANKEDTRQVFEVVLALTGGSTKKVFSRMVATPYGRRMVEEPIKFEEVLSRRDWLASLPQGSLGRAHLAFMEGENLTPDGILDASGEAGIDYECETQFEEFRRVLLHTQVCHDLWHVLTGYGRDGLGEICLLAFTERQTFNPGIRLIMRVGALSMKLEQPNVPILKAIREGRRMGENAEWLVSQDMEKLLPRPLDEVRRALNIAPPKIYQSVPDAIKYSLLKPRVDKTQSEREGGAPVLH